MMTPAQLLAEFLELDEDSKNEFMAELTLWFDLHLPESLDLPFPMKGFPFPKDFWRKRYKERYERRD